MEVGKIYFAYDMSLHGDWVSRYAIRLSLRLKKELKLVTVSGPEDKITRDGWTEKTDRIRFESEKSNVGFSAELVHSAKPVADVLRAIVSENPENILVCGTRPHNNRKGIFTGSISEKLSGQDLFSVISFRVVNPGILGNPMDLLLPVLNKFFTDRDIISIARKFTGENKKLHLLHVISMHPFSYRRLTHLEMESKRIIGKNLIEDLVEKFRNEKIGISDYHSSVTSSAFREIHVQANRTKSRLILLPFFKQNPVSRLIYGNKMEQILRSVSCDVAICKIRANE